MRMISILCLLALCFSGCSDGKPPKAPVTGRVSFQGKPLTNVVVNIIPEDFSFGAYGIPDENGDFDIVSSNGDKGVILGTHKVYVGELEKNATKPVLPGILGKDRMHYARYDKSNLTVEVKKGQNTLLIELE